MGVISVHPASLWDFLCCDNRSLCSVLFILLLICASLSVHTFPLEVT